MPSFIVKFSTFVLNYFAENSILFLLGYLIGTTTKIFTVEWFVELLGGVILLIVHDKYVEQKHLNSLLEDEIRSNFIKHGNVEPTVDKEKTITDSGIEVDDTSTASILIAIKKRKEENGS
jgi:hypothetical protein